MNLAVFFGIFGWSLFPLACLFKHLQIPYRKKGGGGVPPPTRQIQLAEACAFGGKGSPTWRELKKSLTSLSSPKSLRNSVKPKNGINETPKSNIKVRIPSMVPPPSAAILSLKDFPWYRPTAHCSRALKKPRTTVKRGVDERRFLEEIRHTEILRDQYHLAERQRVKERQPVHHKRNLMPGQNDRFIQNQQPENRPEIAGYDEILLYFVVGPLL
jgi:hypothetical protein